jgi:hypothetical protein
MVRTENRPSKAFWDVHLYCMPVEIVDTVGRLSPGDRAGAALAVQHTRVHSMCVTG